MCDIIELNTIKKKKLEYFLVISMYLNLFSEIQTPACLLNLILTVVGEKMKLIKDFTKIILDVAS